MFDTFTDIVQIPVIRVEGELLKPISDYSKLDYPGLRAVADFYKGTVEYLKVRAEVSPIETELCNRKDCYNPRKTCDHSKSQ